jgi:transcriptional regulator with XRE-family HTH domain
MGPLAMQTSPPPAAADSLALGIALREAREHAGMSQGDLARRSSLHRTYVGGIERGERNPSWHNIVRLSRALSLAPSELVGRAEAIGLS